jgi:hypothetical protein
MHWKQDGTKDLYSAASPTFRCTIWRTNDAGWVASIRYGDEQRHREHFPTAEDARKWCEQRVRVREAGKPL